MAQQHTPATVGSAYPSAGRFLFYPIVFVEAVQAMDILEKQCDSAWKRNGWKETQNTKALQLGRNAIRDRAEAYASSAQKQGLLLLCWSGSKVIQLRDEVFA